MSTANPNEAAICAIVINYFGAERTAACIDSLAREPLQRILLVDNSATQAERDAMQAIAQATHEKHPDLPIETLNSEENLGFGRAINAAIAHNEQAGNQPSHYLLMNNDAIADPGLVDELRKTAAAPERPALVSPRIVWGSDSVCKHWYQPLLGHVSHHHFPGAVVYLSGCCLLVDRALLQERRLFDPRFFMYGEDVALNIHARRCGRTLACAEHAVVHHEGSASSRNGSYFYEFHVARGHWLLVESLARNPMHRTLLLLGRGLYLPARALVRSLRARSALPIKALIAAWRQG